MLQPYVETGVNLAFTRGVAAWAFELEHWGRCGQGESERQAVDDLQGECGLVGNHPGEVVQRIDGDEQAFARDHRAPLTAEVAATMRVLEEARAQTLDLVTGVAEDCLDRDDTSRLLPDWATWRTARQLAWHIADTESRYYLPSLGLPSRPREADLRAELTVSAEHLQSVLSDLPVEPLVKELGGEVWTSVKLLRRLAWHERSELRVLRQLLLD